MRLNMSFDVLWRRYECVFVFPSAFVVNEELTTHRNSSNVQALLQSHCPSMHFCKIDGGDEVSNSVLPQ